VYLADPGRHHLEGDAEARQQLPTVGRARGKDER
jgi:hypothetical protein